MELGNWSKVLLKKQTQKHVLCRRSGIRKLVSEYASCGLVEGTLHNKGEARRREGMAVLLKVEDAEDS